MIDEKYFFRLLLNGARDALAVRRTREQGAEDQEVKSALQEGGWLAVWRWGGHPT